MKRLFWVYSLFLTLLMNAQTDFSDSWEDFFSYNNVKDFQKVDDIIYALVDNAVFTYNTSTEELEKLSSVQGLSGQNTTTIHYSNSTERLIIGYENGLIEVVDEDGSITISSDIVNFTESGDKSINAIEEFNNELFLATPFGIVVYDIERLEFGDTYFIGNNSTSVTVNEIEVLNGVIYAATVDGIFTADADDNLLIDFNSWKQSFQGRNFQEVTQFDNQIYVTQGSILYSLENDALTQIRNFNQNIISIKASDSHLSVSLNTIAVVFNTDLNESFQFGTNEVFNFTLNNAFYIDNTIFLATSEFGILSTSSNQSSDYVEIHPEGPLSNQAFSIAVLNNNVWVVYGGYNLSSYVPNGTRLGFSYFDGQNWNNTNFSAEAPVKDLVDIAIDQNSENRAFIGSFAQTADGNIFSGGGLLEIENNQIVNFFHSRNSPLEDLFPSDNNSITTRISGVAFDNDSNLWVADALASSKLKKRTPTGSWSSFDLGSLQTNAAEETNTMFVDRSATVWLGTRRNGVYIFNENGNRQRAFISSPNSGNLPSVNVRSIAVDDSNRVWIGTLSGLVVYNNASGVFNDPNPNANPIVINANEDGFGDRLLGDQTINSIVVDGAENKWFGTDNGGVIYTNPSGQRTLANFSPQNSPLPSSRIVKIAADDSTGKVYFATDRGIVVFNSGVAPFGEVLGEVYAYPNPALKNHERVTITGRNNTNLPNGTNVKILDVAGNLVHETNVIEGQELQGGKVVWNKTNLAGRKVASGVYIVLLSNEDASETSVTKIAIVN